MVLPARPGLHWATSWIFFQLPDSTVGFPHLLWPQHVSRQRSEARNVGASVVSGAGGTVGRRVEPPASVVSHVSSRKGLDLGAQLTQNIEGPVNLQRVGI